MPAAGRFKANSGLQFGLMSIADRVSPQSAKVGSSSRQRLRLVFRAIVIGLAVGKIWATRYVIDPDGTAYADVAREWLRGDWTHALNAYWSPLYIWLYTAALAVFSPSVHWQFPLLHIIALAGFIVAFAAWEWLFSEWELWQGVSSHRVLTDVAGYCVVAWAGLRLTGLGWFNSADVVVMALLLAATAILVRVRRGVATNRDFVFLGIALGAGFLAKTAFSTVIPMFLVVIAVLLRSWTDRRIVITTVTALSIAAPFVAAISIANGRFTMGDSGQLNYSWQVTGMSVEGYKENAHFPGAEIQHPIRVLMDRPRVLSFEQHLVGTLPVHSDVSWWCAGYPVRFDRARQLMIIQSNIRFSVFAFRCPAIFLVLICLPFGALEMTKRFGKAWFVWAPALAFAATYCLVFSDYRYLAGSYALIGFALIAAAWKVRLPRRTELFSTWAIPLLSVLLMGGMFRHMIPQFFGDITGSRVPLEYSNVEIAENMKRHGLKPGDRVATIGASLTAAHVGLEKAQIVAMVPERILHDDTRPGRPLEFTFARTDDFWRSSPQDKLHVFEAFRSVGTKWVFADCVPNWADTSGWQLAGGAQTFRSGDLPFVYFKML